MTACIFCDTDISANVTPEHVLLNALGGRRTTTRVVCGSCNNNFGRNCDKIFAEQVLPVRNLFQLQSGDGKSPPMLRNILAGDERYNFSGDGKPKALNKPFQITDVGGGKFNINVQVSSEVELLAILPHISRKTGISVESLVRQFGAASGSLIIKRPGVVQQSLLFGGPDALRSVVKSLVVLWATHVGASELRTTPFADAINFIRSGSTDFVIRRTTLDTRRLPYDLDYLSRFGLLFNSLQVSSNATGEVVGHFTLYNLVSWQVVLAKSGNFSNQSTGLISNSFEPGIWENYNDQKLPFEWLLTPNTNDEFSNVQNRLEDALKEHFEKAASAEMERIVLEIGEAYGLQLNQPIPQAALKEIMMRYAHWVTSVPYVNAFNLDPYKALVPLGIHNGNKKQTSAK